MDAPTSDLAASASHEDATQNGNNDINVESSTVAVADVPVDMRTDATPADHPDSLAATTSGSIVVAAGTLNADVINAEKENEHIISAEKLGQIEDAILEADQARKEVTENPANGSESDIKGEKSEEHQTMSLPETDISTAKSAAHLSSQLVIDPALANESVNNSEVPPPSATATNNGDHQEDEEETQDIVPPSATSSRHKPRSASAASASTVPRPQRRRKEDKEPTPSTSAVSASSRSRRGKDASEKPASTSNHKDRDGSTGLSGGGTARTRGLAQKQADKADREKEKGKGRRNGSSSRPKIGGKRGSNLSRDAGHDEGDDMDLDGEENEMNGAEDDGDEGITRCICGNNEDDAPGFMIQCDTCRAWQHGPCVGFKDESKCPDTYYCEQCRPELHPTLTSSSSRSGAGGQKKHARSASSSSRTQIQQHQRKHSRSDSYDTKAAIREDIARRDAVNTPTTSSVPALIREASRPTSRPPNSRDRESSASVPPLPASTASSSSYLLSHRSRPSADAAGIDALIDQQKRSSHASHSPSPGSPGSAPNSASSHGPLAADGKRPMYPATSHLSAPAQPKRRSTMNSRESAAFDESIMMANANAIRESRMMAGVAVGGSGSGTGSGYGSEGSNGNTGNPNKRKRRKRDDSEELEREDSMTMEAVKEEDEEAEGEDAKDVQRPNGKRLKRDTTPQRNEQGDHSESERLDRDEGNHNGIDENTLQSEQAQNNPDPGDQSEMPMDEEAEAAYLQSIVDDASPRKRRRRRGPGATAPVRKKTPAKPRVKASALGSQALTEGEETEEPETPTLAEAPSHPLGLDGTDGEATLENPAAAAGLVSTSANRSNRKRKAFAVDENAPPVPGQPASSAAGKGHDRAASPTASVVTTESSHSSSDKPLAAHSVKPKGKTGPSVLEDVSSSLVDPAGSTSALSVNGLLTQGNLALPPSADPAQAPSPAGSASTTTVSATKMDRDANRSTKGGLMPPSALPRGKRGLKNQHAADETEEEEESGTPGAIGAFSSGLGRGKHPNQYTYRGGSRGGPGSRGGSKTSPNKRAAMNAAAAEAARRGYKDRDDTPGAFEDAAAQPPTWGLPDHLAHLYHLLPSQNPAPLGVPSYTYVAQPSSASSPTQAVAAEPLSASSSAASSSSTSSQTLPPPTRHLEPSTKVRFPPRRVSLTEMRKRAKLVLEYMGRVQMDMVDRNNRNRALGLLQGSMMAIPENGGSAQNQQDLSQTPQSAVLVDNLSRQLINFQEKYT